MSSSTCHSLVKFTMFTEDLKTNIINKKGLNFLQLKNINKVVRKFSQTVHIYYSSNVVTKNINYKLIKINYKQE